MSATFVRRVKDPGRYGGGCGGHGLYLRVHKMANGRPSKSWGQRLRIGGKATNVGLGPYPVVTLAEARAKALENRRVAHRGGDPRRGRVPTFRTLAEKVIRLRARSWKAGSNTTRQWRSGLRDHADPVIGAKPVGGITRSDMLAILTPIWHEKHATARKVLERVGVVLRYAVDQGLAQHNVADASEIRAALPKVNGADPADASFPAREARVSSTG